MAKKHDKARPTKIVVVSDLHAGSAWAPVPPRFQMLDEGEVPLHPKRQWLWDRWCEFGEWVKASLRGEPYVLAVNGDCVEGDHHRIKDLVHLDPAVHAMIAAELLRPLAEGAAKVVLIKGTGTHVGHSSESGIGKSLGAVPNEYGTEHASFRRYVRCGRHLVSFTHHCSATSRPWLESGEYSRAIMTEAENARRLGHEVPTVCVRSHRHVPGWFHGPSGSMLVTPAWKLCDGHTHQVVPGARVVVGGAILDLAQDQPAAYHWWQGEPEATHVEA